jgi:Ca2+-transporting ATPase
MRKAWAILWLAIKKFFRIDGVAWAGAFAYNAFFSLFPLLLLLVTLGSLFVDPEQAGRMSVTFLESYAPLRGDLQGFISRTLAGVIEARGQASAVASLILLWLAVQCFATLVYAANRAWGSPGQAWWRLPLKSMAMLGVAAVAVFLGSAAPWLLRAARSWLLPASEASSWVFGLGSFIVPMLLLFLSLSLFYKLAPRQPTRFAQVWMAALGSTVLLLASQSLFALYLDHFSSLNAIYGAFGGIMALLLWIYLSGCIFIFGACLCAAQAEARAAPARPEPAP